jgi:multiple sugar transport system substrate-binding protein
VRRIPLFALIPVLAILVAACGGGESSGPPTLSLYTFTAGSGGAFERAVENCNQRAEGRYTIAIEELPPNADDQREQLARRLAAEDSNIDLLALDVIFTAEFAEAKWIKALPEDVAREASEGTIESTLETARYEDRLYAAPYTSNTQLLWYRRDRVQEPPETWEELIQQAEEIGRPGTMQVQGSNAEGLVVWFNSLLTSAGGNIVDDQGQVALATEPTRAALDVMASVATSPAADPSLPTQAEDQNRLAFETGGPTFMVNYPFIFPSAQENAPDVAEQIAAARYPDVEGGGPSSPPLGGLNLAVGAYTEHEQKAFDALTCLRAPENQLLATELGGLPPTTESLYDDPVVKEAYPGFADLMLESISSATPRPATPAYSDVALATRTVLHPPADIQPDQDVQELRDRVEQAINSEGLL